MLPASSSPNCIEIIFAAACTWRKYPDSAALGGAAFHVSPWAMVLIGVAGLVLFLLGMKYGDQIEAAILKRLSRRKGNDAAC